VVVSSDTPTTFFDMLREGTGNRSGLS
jgi:hypothetical protein